jgi:hypothetical protein
VPFLAERTDTREVRRQAPDDDTQFLESLT